MEFSLWSVLYQKNRIFILEAYSSWVPSNKPHFNSTLSPSVLAPNTSFVLILWKYLLAVFAESTKSPFSHRISPRPKTVRAFAEKNLHIPITLHLFGALIIPILLLSLLHRKIHQKSSRCILCQEKFGERRCEDNEWGISLTIGENMREMKLWI